VNASPSASHLPRILKTKQDPTDWRAVALQASKEENSEKLHELAKKLVELLNKELAKQRH
jgi:hypothetical protein